MFLIPKFFEKKHELVAGDIVEVNTKGKVLTLKVLKGGGDERNF